MQIYLSEVLDWYNDLNSQQEWDEKTYSPTRKKLLSAMESISGYNPEVLLKRLPEDALYEERAILLGKMNQHELALSIYVHKVLSQRIPHLHIDPPSNHVSNERYIFIINFLVLLLPPPSKNKKSPIFLNILRILFFFKSSRKSCPNLRL